MLRLGEIARLVGGELHGPADLEITGAATGDKAGPGETTFAAEKRYRDLARSARGESAGRDAGSVLRLGGTARLGGGALHGPADLELTGAATVDKAGPGEITFAAEKRYLDLARSSRAGCIIVPMDAPELDAPTLRVANPRLAWAMVLEALAPKKEEPAGVHETAVIGKGVALGKNVSIQ